jgi:hypothetical protein
MCPDCGTPTVDEQPVETEIEIEGAIEPASALDAAALDAGRSLRTLDVVGRWLQLVAALGGVAWVVLEIAAYESLRAPGDSGGFAIGSSDTPWWIQLERMFGAVSVLLIAALVLGVGVACCALASWLRLRLELDAR